MSNIFSLLWGAVSAFAIYKIYVEYTNWRCLGSAFFEKPKKFNTNHQVVLITLIFIVYRVINLDMFASVQNLSGLLSLIFILIYFSIATFRKEALYELYLTTYRGQYKWQEVTSYNFTKNKTNNNLIVELKIIGNSKKEEFIEFNLEASKEDFYKDFFKSRIRKQHN